MRERLVERIQKATARAAVSTESNLITVAAPAGRVDPLSFALHAAPDAMAYWEQPDHQFAIAARGAAYTVELEAADDRFAVAGVALRSLRARTNQGAIDGADRAPVLIGGFSFFSTCEWEGFPSGRLVLPELALIKRGERSAWVAAAEVTGATDPASLADRLLGWIHDAQAAAWPTVEPGLADHKRAVAIDFRDPAYLKTVAEAISEIEGTGLSKVVLARRLAVDHQPDLGAFLAALRARYPTCAIFAFGASNNVFCGATPERLARVDGVSVSTAAVAGTAPRGSDATQDEVIADRLRNDPKELEEHGYVISNIRRRLSSGGFSLDQVAPTEVMRLPGIQHLVTPITGTAPVGTNVLDVVGALHPTPAVAGLPVEASLDWIRAYEPLDRGWYAAPVGFCDLAGNGEFRVALRSALIGYGTSRLFAGAGIVRASSPARELEETNLKFGALLPSLLGS